MAKAEPGSTKHTIVMDAALWDRLRHAAIEEKVDVSAILSRLAEQYLAHRRGGKR
jgi:hypothetical protein